VTTASEPTTRTPALQRLIEELEAGRCRPVPPPPPPTPAELAARARIVALLASEPT